MKRDISVSLVTGVVLTVVCCLLSSGRSEAGETRGVSDNLIKMGILLDLTGPAAANVTQILEGIKVHNEYINEKGGINGRKIKLLVEDDHYSIPVTIAAFKKLVFKDKVFALYGPSSTGGTVSLFRKVEKNRIPILPPSLADTIVVPYKRYFFTVAASYAESMYVVVDYIVKDLHEKNPRIALCYPDTEGGKGDLVPALARLKQYGIKPVSKEVLNYGSIDAATQVMSMKRAKVDYVITCGQCIGTAVVLLRDVVKYGFKPKKVFGSYATCDDDTVKGAGKAARFFVGVHVMNSWHDDTPELAEMRNITLRLRPGTEEKPRSKFYVFGWVMDMIYKEGLRRAGRDLNNEVLVDAMEGMSVNTSGLCGPTGYSSTSHKGGDCWRLFKTDMERGKLVPLTGWLMPSK